MSEEKNKQNEQNKQNELEAKLLEKIKRQYLSRKPSVEFSLNHGNFHDTPTFCVKVTGGDYTKLAGLARIINAEIEEYLADWFTSELAES